MAAAPLTHHDILRLVEPFSRRGRQVDLAASDRAARRLAFKPPAPALNSTPPPAWQELLTLEDLGTGSFVLTRTLTRPSGLQATLQALGAEPGTLYEHMDQLPPERQFSLGEGFEIARSYRLQAGAQARTPAREGAAPSALAWALYRGQVQLNGLRLSLQVSGVKGVPGEIALEADSPMALPQDLLAVLGWNWARLMPERPLGTPRWKTLLRLRGPAEERSARAEAALARAAAHLAQTLAEPPSRYHARHRAARWGVFFRRGIPVLNVIALLLAVALMPRFEVGDRPGLSLLLYHVPTLLIGLSFWLQELPAFEIPPWPRLLRQSAWQTAASAQPLPPEPSAA